VNIEFACAKAVSSPIIVLKCFLRNPNNKAQSLFISIQNSTLFFSPLGSVNIEVKVALLAGNKLITQLSACKDKSTGKNYA